MQVLARSYTTCVLLVDGGVLCFGGDSEGQLGQASGFHAEGVLPSLLTTVALPDDPKLDDDNRAVEIAVGDAFVCALMWDHRSIYCWGDNADGQLGTGSKLASDPSNLVPVDLGISQCPATTVLALEAGGTSACALLSNGEVKCWGGNHAGQLGYGDTSARGGDSADLGENLQPLALGAGLSAAPCGPCKARHVGFGGLDCAGECAGGYDAVAHATSTSNCTKLPVVAVLNTTNVGRGRFEIDFPTNIQAVTLLAAVSFPKDKTSDHTGPSDDRELVLGLGELTLHWVDDVPANIAISATAACAPGSGNQLVSEGATFDMSSSYLDDAGDLWDEPWLGSALGWSANTTDGEWVSIDIGSGQEIIGVVTQGATYEDTDGILPEYVESFKVQASVDGVSWSDVDDGAIFTGNSDADTEVFNKFASHVHARYLKIVPETWEEWPTLRFGAVLLACKSCEGGTFAAEAGLRPCTRCESGYSCGSREGCVGVESFEAPAATFSSVDDEYNDSVLDVGIGWSVSEEAESSGSAGDHWIQLDTGALRGIRGVITQGIIYESLPEYVESFTVQASVDGVSWSDVDDGAIFTGNSDGEHHLVNDFATILYARYVKIVPETWEGWPSLRVGVRFAGDDARGYCGQVISECPLGEGLGLEGCTTCPRGTYKDCATAEACDSCPEFSDSPPGSTLRRACLCEAGYTGDAGRSNCTACDVGSYKDAGGAASCSSCPAGTTTGGTASTMLEDCTCLAGYEGQSDGAECTECGVGSYKTEAGVGECLPCKMHATSSPGSTTGEDCRCEVGYENVALIADWNLENVLISDWVESFTDARLGSDGWVPPEGDSFPYYVVDLGEVMDVRGLVVAGAGGNWVTAFDVSVSEDNIDYTYMGGLDGFTGNSDAQQQLVVDFGETHEARYVSIEPTEWNGIDGRSQMTFGVRVTDADGCSPCPRGTVKDTIGDEACVRCSDGFDSCGTRTLCYEIVEKTFAPPLATVSSLLKFVEIEDEATFYEEPPNAWYEFSNPSLDDPVGWSVDDDALDTGSPGDHWVAMDVGSVRAIHGVVTQGEGYDESFWTTSFTVQVSNNSVNWEDVDDGLHYTGNLVENSRMVNAFLSVVYARYVKIVPQTWEGTVSLRAGVRIGPEPGACGEEAPECLPGNTASLNGVEWECVACAEGSVKDWTGPQSCNQCLQWTETDTDTVHVNASCASRLRCFSQIESYVSGEFSTWVLFENGTELKSPQLDHPDGWSTGGQWLDGEWIDWGLNFATAGQHWVQLDTGSARLIRGVVTQGEGYDERYWTTSFSVQVSSDGTTWSDVDDGATFTGNTDADNKVTTLFASAVSARYIKVFPQSWEDGEAEDLDRSVSMRVGVLFNETELHCT